jgi:hypothetical protein
MGVIIETIVHGIGHGIGVLETALRATPTPLVAGVCVGLGVIAVVVLRDVVEDRR